MATAKVKTANRFLLELRDSLFADPGFQSYCDWIQLTDFARLGSASHGFEPEKAAANCAVVSVLGLLESEPSLESLTAKIDRAMAAADTSLAPQYQWLRQVPLQRWEQVQTQWKLIADAAESQDVAEFAIASLDRAARKQAGVYFTPQCLARKVVQDTFDVADQIDLCLDQATFLDSSAGGGAFLLAAFEEVQERSERTEPGASESKPVNHKALAERLHGVELNPGLASVLHWRLWNRFQQANVDLARPLPIYCGDAIRLVQQQPHLFCDVDAIIGNPPFGALTTNTNPWMTKLLKGEHDGVSYFQVDGHPLGERKVWLYDDYVQFFRLSQFLLQGRRGMISLVTNHSFLDALTFRGMRWQLLNDFQSVAIHEISKTAGHFPINADVCYSIFARSHDRQQNETQDIGLPSVRFVQSEKETTFQPSGPSFGFRPSPQGSLKYASWWSLDELMPTNGSAAITARDFFAIDIDRQRLVDRVSEFCDLSIDDDTIRAKYFQRTRSKRFAPGDTRGWKLSQARKAIADDDWERRIKRCAYRPFDSRWILWTPDIVDWPRDALMAHLDHANNFAIVARRQFPIDQPACYFFASDHIVLDGLVRSDNRGIEKVFPVLVLNDGEWTPNFAPKAFESFRDVYATIKSSESDSALAIDFARYLYGLFHWPHYRETYQRELSSGFPRLPILSDPASVRSLVEAGGKLLELHLAKLDHDRPAQSSIDLSRKGLLVGKAVYESDQARISFAGFSIDSVTLADWEFRVGTHQVLRKWIKDRKSITIDQPLVIEYATLVDRIRATRELIEGLSSIPPT